MRTKSFFCQRHGDRRGNSAWQWTTYLGKVNQQNVMIQFLLLTRSYDLQVYAETTSCRSTAGLLCICIASSHAAWSTLATKSPYFVGHFRQFCHAHVRSRYYFVSPRGHKRHCTCFRKQEKSEPWKKLWNQQLKLRVLELIVIQILIK